MFSDWEHNKIYLVLSKNFAAFNSVLNYKTPLIFFNYLKPVWYIFKYILSAKPMGIFLNFEGFPREHN